MLDHCDSVTLVLICWILHQPKKSVKSFQKSAYVAVNIKWVIYFSWTTHNYGSKKACMSTNSNRSRHGCQQHDFSVPVSGCGPLPRTGGLSWKTLSGRPVLKNSTVYEEYFPRCPPGSTLNHNSSVRCGENLKWNVNPEELQCKTNECGRNNPRPVFSEYVSNVIRMI